MRLDFAYKKYKSSSYSHIEELNSSSNSRSNYTFSEYSGYFFYFRNAEINAEWDYDSVSNLSSKTNNRIVLDDDNDIYINNSNSLRDGWYYLADVDIVKKEEIPSYGTKYTLNMQIKYRVYIKDGPVKGGFIENIVALDGEYPDDGYEDGNWYIKAEVYHHIFVGTSQAKKYFLNDNGTIREVDLAFNSNGTIQPL